MTTTISKTFAAVEEVSATLLLQKGQSASYAISVSGTATLVLEKSHDGLNWSAAAAAVASATLSSVVYPVVDRETRLRWRCSAYTSGSPIAAIVTRTDTISEVRNADGDVVFRITDNGIETPSVTGLGETTAPVPTATVSTLLTVSGLLSLGTPETAITATAGGTQALAQALSALVSVHEVTVCATNADSVKLPAPSVVGELHLVINNGAASLQVFGSGTDTINAVATATGVAVATIKRAWFIALTTGTAARWAMILGA